MRLIRRGSLLLVTVFLLLPVGAYAKKGGNGANNGHDAAVFTTHDFRGTYAFRLVSAKSFTANAPGDPGGIASAPRQDILRVGVFTADGAGNITAGHTLATTDTNAGATELIDFTWTGTYTVNPDGTGTLSIADPLLAAQTCTDMTAVPPVPGPCVADDEGAETYSIVISDHGEDKTVELTQTDNVGGGAKIFMTGQARRQRGD